MSNPSDVRSQSMLVSLHIKKWGISKKDEEVTKTATNQYGADASAGNFSKKLLPKKAVEDINKIATEARQLHLELTMPWKDDGRRLLPIGNYHDYRQRMNLLHQKFNDAVEEFTANYGTYVAEARDTLGAMFKEGEYPEVDTLKTKYSFRYDVEPLPNGMDARLDIDETALAEFQKEVEDRTAQLINESYQSVLKETATALKEFGERLQNYGTEESRVFKDALVINTQRIIESLKACNIFGNQEVAAIQAELEAVVGQYDPKTLRTDAAARKQAAEAAAAGARKLAECY